MCSQPFAVSKAFRDHGYKFIILVRIRYIVTHVTHWFYVPVLTSAPNSIGQNSRYVSVYTCTHSRISADLLQAPKHFDCLRDVGGWGSIPRFSGGFLPRATIFLVLTAFNSVLPELVVLISTTNSGGTALNAADRILTRKVVARGSKIGVSTPSPPRLYSPLD